LQQGIIQPQIHCRHAHLGRHRQRRRPTQHRPHRLLTDRPPLVQQFCQGLFDTCLPFLSRQVQNPHVLTIRTPRLLLLQRVIGPAERHRRVQILPVHITRERSRLPHQPIDHVSIVDAVFRLATQPLHGLRQRTRVPHLDGLSTDPCFHPLPKQSCRHRVDVLFHLDRAALAHAHPPTFQRLQPLLGQGTQPRLLLLKLLRTTNIPPILQGTHEPPVLLAAGEVAAATEKQFLLQRLLEATMSLLAIAVLMAARRIGRLGRHTVVTHQGLIPGCVFLGVAVVVNGQRHAVGAMPLGYAAQFPQRVL
jgi:hypothetical protein